MRFDHHETYNEPFELDLVVASQTVRDVDFNQLLDVRGRLKIWDDDKLQRTISGIVTFAEQGEYGKHFTFYHFKIQPEAYRMTLRRDCRIFQLQSIENIIKTLLDEHHILFYHISLINKHLPREFCVQYRETDFEFLQRLCGEEGISFYFEDDDGQDRIVFYDDFRWFDGSEIYDANFNSSVNAQLNEKVVTRFRYANQLRPHYAQLRDYTFKKS